MRSTGLGREQLVRIAGMALVVLGLTGAFGDAGAATAAGTSPGDWPGFRGPGTDNVISGAGVFDGPEAPGLALVWKAALGGGYSGVSVVGNQAVTMASDGKDDWVVAFDAAQGKELWRHKVAPTYAGHDGSHTGPISTPMVADGRVFALGPKGDLVALRLADGGQLWAKNLEELGAEAPYYGYSTSPLMADGVLIVGLGKKEGGALAAFDPATGEVLWTVGDDGVSYQSPAVLTLAGGEQLVAAGNSLLFGLDPKNGTILWQYEHGGGGAMGAGSMSPVPTGENRLFLAHKSDASKSIRVLPKGGGGFDVKEEWTTPSIRGSYNIPVYHEGYLYGFSARFLTCVDAATGESVWKSRQPPDGFLTLVDGHLLAVSKRGTLHLAKASPEGYEEITQLEVFDDHAWTPVSFAHGRIYARSQGELAAIEIVSGGQKARPTLTGMPVEGRLAAFLDTVAKAEDKAAVVDAFLAGIESFPLVEGETLVHFLYRGDAEDVSMGGDLIGDRREEALARVEGTDLFVRSARLKPDTRGAYWFIKDFGDAMADPRNPRHQPGIDDGGEVSWFSMPRWQAPTYFAEVPEDKRGRMETLELESEGFEGKRPFRVYLPTGYDDGDARYPVAYLHGGGEAIEQGELPRALDNLMGSKTAPFIAVFIEQTEAVSAGREFFGPQKDAYAQMVADVLVPLVDGRFRTVPRREARASVGMGFSAYPAFYVAFRQPETFGKISGQSTFMLSSNYDELVAAAPNEGGPPLDIYLEWGTYDLRGTLEGWSLVESSSGLDGVLRQKGYAPAGGEVSDGFGWGSWKTRLDRVFAFLFPPNGGG